MPSFVRPTAVIAPLGNWFNVALFECHDYAPLFANIMYGLSAEYGDRDGWIDARYVSPGAIIRTLGPVAPAMRLTKPQATSVLDALASHGHIERSEDGAVRMAGYAHMVERHSAAMVRIANSSRQREIHQRRIKHLADKPMLTVEPSTLTVEPVAAHDAPVQTATDQDRHYLGIPSGCFRKRKEIIQDGGCGGKDGRLHLVANPEPAESRRLSADDATLILKMAYTRDKTPTDWPMERRLCVRMLRLMVIAKPNRVLPTQYHMKKWENDMRLLLQDRNGDHAAINSVLKWALEPGSFWAPNIASPSKLRAKFDQVEAQMEREQPPEPVESFSTTEVPRQYTQVVT